MRGTFDACVASHVIEHIPDLIGFFRGACNLLTPNGVVSLAIPDKRYCFDWFRPHSTTGQLLEAHRNADFRHRPAALFDQSAYASTNDGTIGWTQAPLGAMKLMTPTLISAYGFFNSQPSDDYVDCHGWQFTPASFELIVLELAAVGVIDFEIETAFPSEGCEFIVQMRKVQKLSLSGDRLEAKRLELLHRIVEELGVQADHQRAALALMR
jgi:SAM-dependent methyltransferase